jgi:acetyltransferase-like isoleucine patch superfamily enzyme
MNVHIHPTAWLAPKALIRCTGGGEIFIGKYCEIHDYAMIDALGGSVQMGDHSSLNPFAIVYGYGGTVLGSGVRIAAHTVIIPANHVYDSTQPLYKAGVKGVGISIGSDVWIGAGARILDGVVIGDGSVVGAGAVVTRSIPAGCIASGVPARSMPIERPVKGKGSV